MIKYILLFFMLPLGLFAQDSALYTNQWTLYPNFNLEKNLEVGDSLVFIVNDSLMYNPKITLRVDRTNQARFSLTSFSYPTKNGIVLTTDYPKPTYSYSRDTLVEGNTVTTRELKVQDEINILHGPASLTMCFLKEELVNGIFSCSVPVGHGSDNFIEGPFNYFIEGDRLILIKR